MPLHILHGIAELIGFNFGHACLYHEPMTAATLLGGYSQKRGLTRYGF